MASVSTCARVRRTGCSPDSSRTNGAYCALVRNSHPPATSSSTMPRSRTSALSSPSSSRTCLTGADARRASSPVLHRLVAGEDERLEQTRAGAPAMSSRACSTPAVASSAASPRRDLLQPRLGLLGGDARRAPAAPPGRLSGPPSAGRPTPVRCPGAWSLRPRRSRLGVDRGGGVDGLRFLRVTDVASSSPARPRGWRRARRTAVPSGSDWNRRVMRSLVISSSARNVITRSNLLTRGPRRAPRTTARLRVAEQIG